jgi:hypothetical protein
MVAITFCNFSISRQSAKLGLIEIPTGAASPANVGNRWFWPVAAEPQSNYRFVNGYMAIPPVRKTCIPVYLTILSLIGDSQTVL